MKKRLFIALVLACACLTGCCFHVSDDLPTCTEPCRCSKCGKIVIHDLGHDWSASPVETIKGTCTEKGGKVYKCGRCGETQFREEEYGPHSPGDSIKEGHYMVTRCSSCDAVISSEELPIEEDIDYLVENCVPYTYEQMARNPESVKGNLAVVTGEVIQVIENGNDYKLRVDITLKGESYQYYDDTIFVTYTKNPDDPRILEDDIVTIYGVLDGLMTYESILNQQISLPSLIGKYLVINE